MVEMFQTDAAVSLGVVREQQEWVIEMRPTLVHAVMIGNERVLRPGADLGRFTTTIAHTLLPLVVFITTLAALPVRKPSDWLYRCAAALPAFAVLLATGAPLLLASRIQMTLAEANLLSGLPYRDPTLGPSLVFMESGGRWLIALVLGLSCALPFSPAQSRIGPHHAHDSTSNDQQVTFPPVRIE
jgi:hypothetical protein